MERQTPRVTPRVSVIDRRSFLVAAAGLTLGVAFPGARRAARAAEPRRLNAFARLAPDGTVTVVMPAVEMGQGVHGALARFLAEEMDLDWSAVRIEPAPTDPAVYGNPEFWGLQITGGSRTMPGYAPLLRVAGAEARHVLLATAAAVWGTDADRLATEPGRVVDPASGARLAYGDLAERIVMPDTLPQFYDPEPLPRAVFDHLGEGDAFGTEAGVPGPAARRGPRLPLKRRASFRLIGTDLPRPDLPAKTDGSAVFGSDVHVPGMVYAMVETAPVAGNVPLRVDGTAARAVPGVIDVITLPYGVAVVGETVRAVRLARAALDIAWSEGRGADGYDSARALDDFARIARSPDAEPGVRTMTAGDDETARALLAGAEVEVHEVRFEFTYHATLEPQCAVVRPLDGGARAEVWTSHQAPTEIRRFAAEALDLPEDAVTVHTPYCGGGYGRRTEGEVTTDAALIAKAVGRPVKVIWTREDDLLRNPHRQSAALRMEAAVDGAGWPLATRVRVVSDSWSARRMPVFFEESGNAEPMNWVGAIHPYATRHQLIDCVTLRGPIPVCLLRGVGQSQGRMVVETMIDRLARRAGVDPLAYRLALLEADPLGRAVLERVAAMADWGSPRPGRGVGLALVPYDGTYLAIAAEASVARETGAIRVHHLWCALECGLVASPDAVRGQIAGGALMGLSFVLSEEVTYEGGRPRQSNFDDYRLLRMSEAPRVAVEILPSGRDMAGGVGQVATATVGPAVANAVADATGVFLQHVPMTPDRVRTALGGRG